MRKTLIAASALLTVGLAAPAFAQNGATSSPPAPNAAVNAPSSPNSLPQGARTLPPGSTGIEQMGNIAGGPVTAPVTGTQPNGSGTELNGNSTQTQFGRTAPRPIENGSTTLR